MNWNPLMRRLFIWEGKLTRSDAFMSKMKKDEKFTPIITLVVYCGTEHGWDGARCLYDLIDIDDEMKEFVTNYRLNLYDCHEHDAFDEYQTGLRQLFEVTRYCKDKEQLKRVIEENWEAYSNLDSETIELIKVAANVDISDEHKTIENGEERYNMCKAIEDMIADGLRLQRKRKALQNLRRICKK